MGYADFVLKHTRLDRLMMERDQYKKLMNDLTNQWMTYASHKDTGIVYDMDVLRKRVNELEEEISALEQELEGE